jgi:hypothetical protein
MDELTFLILPIVFLALATVVAIVVTPPTDTTQEPE